MPVYKQAGPISNICCDLVNMRNVFVLIFSLSAAGAQGLLTHSAYYSSDRSSYLRFDVFMAVKVYVVVL
jgi:hypothetical protein